jgi:hypothetical protein
VFRLWWAPDDSAREKRTRPGELAIANHCVTKINADKKPAREIMFDHASNISGKIRLNATTKSPHCKNLIERTGRRGSRRTEELSYFGETEKAGPGFGEDAKLPPSLAHLRAELTLK